MAIPIAVARIIAITQGRTPERKPPCVEPINVAILTASGTGVDSETAILVSSLFSVYPQHTVTDADMRLNVLRTVLLRLQLFA